MGDLLTPGDVVVLVIPLDSAAPKGRIILPQQQVMRDALDAGAFPCATGVEGLPDLLAALARPPRLVVTDSQPSARWTPFCRRMCRSHRFPSSWPATRATWPLN